MTGLPYIFVRMSDDSEADAISGLLREKGIHFRELCPDKYGLYTRKCRLVRDAPIEFYSGPDEIRRFAQKYNRPGV